MRRIDKSQPHLASAYFQAQLAPGPYRSSGDRHYLDVLANLLICQQGLCAYTEYRLLSREQTGELARSFGPDGRFTGSKPEIPADLDHFDPARKSSAPIAWDNLFAVYAPVNQRVKRAQPADPLMKPDLPEYDPFRLLQYDRASHQYLPAATLDQEEAERVLMMISVLGLNWGHIRERRRAYVEQTLLAPDPAPEEYLTAFDLIRRQSQSSDTHG